MLDLNLVLNLVLNLNLDFCEAHANPIASSLLRPELEKEGGDRKKFRVSQYDDKQITQSCGDCMKKIQIENNPHNHSMSVLTEEEEVERRTYVLVKDVEIFRKKKVVIEQGPAPAENVAAGDCRNSELKDIICDCDGSVQVREMTPEEETKAANVCVDNSCLVVEPPPTAWWKLIYCKGNIITEQEHINVIDLSLDGDILTCKFEYQGKVDHMSIKKGDKDWEELEFVVEKKDGHKCDDTCEHLKPLIFSCEGEMEMRHINDEERQRSMVTTIGKSF